MKIRIGSVWKCIGEDGLPEDGLPDEYLFAQAGMSKFCLINLRTGNRYLDPIFAHWHVPDFCESDEIELDRVAWNKMKGGRVFMLVRSKNIP